MLTFTENGSSLK